MYKKPSAAEKIAYFDTATTVLMVLTAAGLLTLALSVIATKSSSLGWGFLYLALAPLLRLAFSQKDTRTQIYAALKTLIRLF
jgi:hypothetical protein